MQPNFSDCLRLISKKNSSPANYCTDVCFAENVWKFRGMHPYLEMFDVNWENFLWARIWQHCPELLFVNIEKGPQKNLELFEIISEK